MFEAYAEIGRTTDLQFKLYEDDGTTTLVLASTDVVRFKAGRRSNAQPDLDLDSAARTSNGSGFTIDSDGSASDAQVTLRLAQADTSGLTPGVYDAEIMVVDDSDTSPANAVRHIEYGVLHLTGTLGGSIGLT